jgi:hypothetical protein
MYEVSALKCLSGLIEAGLIDELVRRGFRKIGPTEKGLPWRSGCAAASQA